MTVATPASLVAVAANPSRSRRLPPRSGPVRDGGLVPENAPSVDVPTIEVSERARALLAEALAGDGRARYVRIRVGRG